MVLRYIYKISTSRLRRANWNLNLSIPEAIQNEEIVSVGENTLIRFVDNLNGTIISDVRNDVRNIEKQIRKIKSMPTSMGNRNQIKKLYERRYKKLFIKDYVSIVIDNNRDFNRINNSKGFFINGIKYKRLLGTPSGIKKRTIFYVNENMYEELNKRIENGRDLSKEIVPSKLESYKSLVCSSSIPVSNPKGILVVDDCVTEFKANVITIDDTQSDLPVIKHEKDYPITFEESDGYGLISPELSKKWLGEISDEDYVPSGFCIRNSFCKGMVFTFDFQKFGKEVANNFMVRDIWGCERDIRGVDLVLTASMLKLWDSYDSLEHYLSCCEKNGYSFSVTQYAPAQLENERNLNYQFIQSLYLDDQGIEDLIAPTVQEIHDVLGLDYRKSILFLKGKDIDFQKEDDDFIKALMVDRRIINDPFVRSKIRNMIKKRIDEAKVGVLKVSGNFSIVSGDPYSLCQSIFGMKITGLLGAGEFYAKYWTDRGVNRVACFRAPMTCHNNIRILNLKNTQEMQYWYEYMDTVTIFNSWDTTAHALNGLDKDGDIVLTTDNPTILGAIRETDAIFCVQKDAVKKVCTEQDLIQSNKNGFGDEIGVTTNHITSMFDVLANFEEDSVEYKEVMNRIMCGQNYQQNAIDKIKGIVCKKMPKEWYNYGSALDKKIVANKKPYFFIYIYPHRKREYKRFVKKANLNCLMRFGVGSEELLGMEIKNKEQQMYMGSYYARIPVSISNSIMNKICWRVEREFDFYRPTRAKDKFNSCILKTDKGYTKGRYGAIKELYGSYIKKAERYSVLSKLKKMDADEQRMHREIFKEEFKSLAYGLCNDAEELCNIVVDICYKSNKSKQFVWDICGDVIIRNLLKNNNYQVAYPVLDENGDIKFGGENFSMRREVVDAINLERKGSVGSGIG